jgi:PIN domain nuclease of toxin-antitoxin system
MRQRVSEYVADASAVLAFARGEPGEKRVRNLRTSCVLSSINLMEAYSKLVRYDVPADQVQRFLRESFPSVIPLDRELAENSAVLHTRLNKLGISYADCACLSLGMQRKATVLTADRNWKQIELDVKVELIR